MGASATFSKSFCVSERKRWEFVSINFAVDGVKSHPSNKACWMKSVIKTSWIKENLLPLSPSNENLSAA